MNSLKPNRTIPHPLQEPRPYLRRRRRRGRALEPPALKAALHYLLLLRPERRARRAEEGAWCWHFCRCCVCYLSGFCWEKGDESQSSIGFRGEGRGV
jgi:hypothetical protein